MERIMVYSDRELGEMFDRQLSVLEMCGCPLKVIELIRSKKSISIEKASGMPFKPDNLPILTVVPFSVWGLDSQLRVLRSKLEKTIGGEVGLGTSRSVNSDFVGWRSPNNGKTYSLFDVDRKRPLLMRNRRFLTLNEAIAFLIQREDGLLEGKEVLTSRDDSKLAGPVYCMKLDDDVLRITRADVEDIIPYLDSTPSCVRLKT
jgi:hypothetical protein